MNDIFVYNEVLVSHLRRMSNLERLSLTISIDHEKRFLDGNNLKNDIVSHMPRLKEFLFNVRQKTIELENQFDFPSTEDIKCTLTSLSDVKVICCVGYFSKDNIGHCHFYTYPYTLIHYNNITNNFSRWI